MKFAEDHNSALYKISGYDQKSIGINGVPHEKSLVLAPNDLISNWEPDDFEALTAEHLDVFYQLNPEIILLGTGETQRFPRKDILRRFAKGQIGFEIMDTQAACRTFNILMAEGRNVVAGLFLR